MGKGKLQCPNCRSTKVTVRGKRVLIRGLFMVTGILTAMLFFVGYFLSPALMTAALFVWLGGLALVGVVWLVPAARVEMYNCRTCDFRWLRGQFDGDGAGR